MCLFTYFHNVATSASAIIEIDGSILMIERNNDPGKGMLGLPGGFVNPGEKAEDAAVRECFEETGLIAANPLFVGSWPNEYIYKNVIYKTCDIYFSAQVEGGLAKLDLDPVEAATVRLLHPEEVANAPLAFESHRMAIQAWLEKKASKNKPGCE